MPPIGLTRAAGGRPPMFNLHLRHSYWLSNWASLSKQAEWGSNRIPDKKNNIHRWNSALPFAKLTTLSGGEALAYGCCISTSCFFDIFLKSTHSCVLLSGLSIGGYFRQQDVKVPGALALRHLQAKTYSCCNGTQEALWPWWWGVSQQWIQGDTTDNKCLRYRFDFGDPRAIVPISSPVQGINRLIPLHMSSHPASASWLRVQEDNIRLVGGWGAFFSLGCRSSNAEGEQRSYHVTRVLPPLSSAV